MKCIKPLVTSGYLELKIMVILLYALSMHYNVIYVILGNTRRVPVQRAVERDEIPYPYKVHDTTLRPLLNITIQKHIYIANYISRIY